MDANMKTWLNRTIQVYPIASQDGAGDVTTGAVVTLPCYIYGNGSKLIRNRDGEEVLCEKTICLDGASSIHLKDVVYIDGHKYPIMNIVPYYNALGSLDFVEVYV